MVAVTPPPTSPRVTLPVISTVCGAIFLGFCVAVGLKVRAERRWPRGLLAGCSAALVCGVISFPYARVSFAIPIPGSRAIQPQQAKEVLGGLLHNIYRAFDWREESAIYDRLALSITGELLSEVYLQTRRSMELEGQGGARAKVDDVEIVELADGRISENDAQEFRCRWNVSGSVGHWGHVHRRANQYDATLEITPVNGVWKITKIDLRDEKRLDSNKRS